MMSSVNQKPLPEYPEQLQMEIFSQGVMYQTHLDKDVLKNVKVLDRELKRAFEPLEKISL